MAPPRPLPANLQPWLLAQKRAILRALQSLPDVHSVAVARTDSNAQAQLNELLAGTAARGEGNICLVLGPRGCGKTRLVDSAVSVLSPPPIVVRLSGHAQLTDRMAVHEMARQIAEQTGRNLGTPARPADMDDVDDTDDSSSEEGCESSSFQLPPPAHILSAVTALPSLNRPVVVILDAFDLFAAHARQAFLYCLFDTAQSCHGGDKLSGIAVIGVTSRIDSITLLEKRVKSRFSHRIIHVSAAQCLEEYVKLARSILTVPPCRSAAPPSEWTSLWNGSVDVSRLLSPEAHFNHLQSFFADDKVARHLEDTFHVTRDVRMLCRVLAKPVLAMTPKSFVLKPVALLASVHVQRASPHFPYLSSLPFPAVGLLVAASHCRSAGHDCFTFEMLHERFETQIRTSSSAPVQLGGIGIGMPKCSRTVMKCAFENLRENMIFQAATVHSNTLAQDFGKFRCVPCRDDILAATEHAGRLDLKKWFLKDQT